MTDKTVQRPIGGWFPDRPADDPPTDRYPEVNRIVNDFFTEWPKTDPDRK